MISDFVRTHDWAQRILMTIFAIFMLILLIMTFQWLGCAIYAPTPQSDGCYLFSNKAYCNGNGDERPIW